MIELNKRNEKNLLGYTPLEIIWIIFHSIIIPFIIENNPKLFLFEAILYIGGLIIISGKLSYD